MPFGYPVFLELAGRKAVVIGTGAVAEGKVEGLLAAAAEVMVVAEAPMSRLDRLEREERVTVARRPFRPQDLDGAFVCVAWSDDPDTRDRIYREGRARGVLVNVMDDIPHCDFAAPAIVRRGDLVIAVSTGGGSPTLARRLREELSERFGPEWEEILDLLREVREETLPELPELPERTRRWRRALDLEEIETLVREGRRDEMRVRLIERLIGQGAA